MGKRGPKSPVDKSKLIALYLDGVKPDEIAKKLGVSRGTIDRHLTRYRNMEKTVVKREDERVDLMFQLTQEFAELRLGKMLKEAEDNYFEAKRSGDPQLIGGFMKQYQDAINMLLKATGTYARAEKAIPELKDNELKIMVEFVSGQA